MGQVEGVNVISTDVKRAVVAIAEDLIDNFEHYTAEEVIKVKNLLSSMKTLNATLEYHDVEVEKPKVVERNLKKRRGFWKCMNDFIK